MENKKWAVLLGTGEPTQRSRGVGRLPVFSILAARMSQKQTKPKMLRKGHGCACLRQRLNEEGLLTAALLHRPAMQSLGLSSRLRSVMR